MARLFYERQDVNGHVLCALMWGIGKMSPNLFQSLTNIVKVILESIHQAPFSLPDVLFMALFAGDAIYQVMRFATAIAHGMKFSLNREKRDV